MSQLAWKGERPFFSKVQLPIGIEMPRRHDIARTLISASLLAQPHLAAPRSPQIAAPA